MKIALGLGIIGLLVCGGCSQPQMNHLFIKEPAGSWESQLGQRVTVEGIAVNAKLGPCLLTSDGKLLIWIDGLEAWPRGWYRGGNDGTRLRVSGRIIRRRDLPVFIEHEGPQSAGMPMPKGTDLKKAGIRYLLQEATWEVIEGSE